MTTSLCALCGKPMPVGEEMFKYHGYSGPCPGPTKPNPTPSPSKKLREIWNDHVFENREIYRFSANSPASDAICDFWLSRPSQEREALVKEVEKLKIATVGDFTPREEELMKGMRDAVLSIIRGDKE